METSFEEFRGSRMVLESSDARWSYALGTNRRLATLQAAEIEVYANGGYRLLLVPK